MNSQVEYKIDKKYIKENLGIDLSKPSALNRQEYMEAHGTLPPSHQYMENEKVKFNGEDLTLDDIKTILIYHNGVNRPLDLGTAVNYLKDMLGGNWRDSGDPIRFGNSDNEHQLIDGQHRSLALALAKFIKSQEASGDDSENVVSSPSVLLDVAAGLDPSVMGKVDRGKPRSPQVQLMLTYPHIVPNKTAATSAWNVAKRILKHFLKPENQRVICASSNPTDEEIVGFITSDDYKDAFYNVLKSLTVASSEALSNTNLLKKLRQAAVINALVRYASVNPQGCQSFLKTYVSGQLVGDADQTVVKFRDYVLSLNPNAGARGKKGTGYDEIYAKALYAIHNWDNGVVIKKLLKQKNWESYDYSQLAPQAAE